jgi:GNAT superfamily N-acetyltransferase
LIVRAAGPEDAGLILELVRELAAFEREPDAVAATAEDFRRELASDHPAFGCLIAELDGRPAGFALFFHNFSTFKGRPGIYLEDLFVRPEARGRGIGKRLLAWLARTAVERRCARLEWAVLDWNEPSIGFYRSLGAVAMDEWTTFRLTGEALALLAGSARAHR